MNERNARFDDDRDLIVVAVDKPVEGHVVSVRLRVAENLERAHRVKPCPPCWKTIENDLAEHIWKFIQKEKCFLLFVEISKLNKRVRPHI